MMRSMKVREGRKKEGGGRDRAIGGREGGRGREREREDRLTKACI